MHDNMFSVLGILATVTHMSVNEVKLMKMRLKLIMPSFDTKRNGSVILFFLKHDSETWQMLEQAYPISANESY